MVVFYHSYEVTGNDKLPNNQGIILCVNHVNALIDAAVLQASTDKEIRTLARDGLFKNPFLKPILNMVGSVPIYRRETEQSDTSKNQDTFARCYELLANNETLVIFPEGQSHSKSFVQDIKTGAARMALGAIQANGVAPIVIPVGMTFHRQKSFRTEVLVSYGEPINLTVPDNMTEYDAVRLITDRVKKGIEKVTLNTNTWKDLAFVKRLERFFSQHHETMEDDLSNKNETTNRHVNATEALSTPRLKLSERFHVLQQLIEAQDLLIEHEPDKIRSLMSKLRVFEKLCDVCGMQHLHHSKRYQPVLFTLYILRILAILLIGFPIALWGLINSIIPYALTQFFTKKLTRKVDQHDTTWVMLGMLFFGIFWGLQCRYVYVEFGVYWSLIYLISIIFACAVALKLRIEFQITIANIKVFYLFLRRKDLRQYLHVKRNELETELTHMVRIAKRLSNTNIK